MKNKKKFILNQEKMRMILADRNIPSGAKVVLLNLTYRLGGKNYSFPSQETIAEDIGLSERQVRNHLALLKKNNIISWERGAFNPKTKSKINANKYDLSSILREREI